VSLDLAILGVLAEGELHGYDVKKRIADLPGAPLRTSFGALYPALGRLEGKGFVKVAEANQPKHRSLIPMPASLAGEAAIFGARKPKAGRGGRRKKIYAIADDGRSTLTSLLLDDVADDRSFPLQVAFCSNLAPADRLALFERRRAHLAERAARPTAIPEGIDYYLQALLVRHGNALTADLAWLDQLIQHEKAQLDPSDSSDQNPSQETDLS